LNAKETKELSSIDPDIMPNIVVIGDIDAGKTTLIWALSGHDSGVDSSPRGLTTPLPDEPIRASFGAFICCEGELSDNVILKQIKDAKPRAVLYVVDACNDISDSNLDRFCQTLKKYEEHSAVDKFLILNKCDRETPKVNERYLIKNYNLKAIHHTAALKTVGIQELRSNLRDSLSDMNDDTELSDVAICVRHLSGLLCELVAKNPDALQDIEWRDLERLLSVALQEIGFNITLTPPAKDGGKDIVANCIVGNETAVYYIEIKHWRSDSQPSNSHVSDFVEVNVRDNTTGGLFISSSGYTRKVYGRIGELMQQRVYLGQREKIVSLCQHYVLKKSGVWYPDNPLPEILFENTVNENKESCSSF